MIKYLMSKLVPIAMWIIQYNVKHSEGYLIAWQSNIAVSGTDEGLSWAGSNKAAERFMQRTFNVSTDLVGNHVHTER